MKQSEVISRLICLAFVERDYPIPLLPDGRAILRWEEAMGAYAEAIRDELLAEFDAERIAEVWKRIAPTPEVSADAGGPSGAPAPAEAEPEPEAAKPPDTHTHTHTHTHSAEARRPHD